MEYIIVDGGSTDGSVDIIQQYADRLAWWTSEPDSGQAEAINKGFTYASGEYIAWLNSDDIFLPGAVQSALDVLLKNPELGMVFGNALTIDENGVPINNLVFSDWGLVELMCFRIICQPAVFMKRSILEKAGFLDQSYHFMLDHQLWIRIAMQAPIKHIPKPLAAARHHPLAKNTSQPEKFADESMLIVDWMAAQEELDDLFIENHSQIMGGAYRLQARYLLDGGKPKDALIAYGRALAAYPSFAIKHWHRIIYAILCLFGAGQAASDYYRKFSHNQRNFSVLSENDAYGKWPGLTLNGRKPD